MTPIAATAPATGLRARTELTLPPIAVRREPGDRRPVLDLVIPVHNEERCLEWSVRRVQAHLAATLPFTTRILVADNASTDDTPRIGTRLARDLPDVGYVRLEAKGRGRALKAVWAASDADVCAYTDVDLSTDLAALPALLGPLFAGDAGVAIGSRLAPGAQVSRGAKREVISRTYNLMLRTGLRARFDDAQCGFKAIRTDVARAALPLVADDGWFFDTELLVLAQRAGIGVHEVPVRWVDDPDSRVDIVTTATADLRGMWRIRRDTTSTSVRRRLTEILDADHPVSRAG